MASRLMFAAVATLCVAAGRPALALAVYVAVVIAQVVTPHRP